jgi:putative methyltransferase (TIGR04325 family)
MMPVVFIHFNEIPAYLIRALNQALLQNRQVVLITDAKTEIPGVSVHDAAVYAKGLEAFENAYVHMSTNSEEFERICIHRWFILKNFMNESNTEVAYYSDSDTMIYSDLALVYEQYKEYDASYTLTENQDNYRWSASACCSYWKKEAINGFCEFVLDTYKNNLATLRKKWDYHLQNQQQGGICDMTLLFLFIEKIKFFPLSKTRNGMCFDQNMLSDENYHEHEYDFGYNKELGREVKTIKMMTGTPHYISKKTNSPIRINAIPEYAKLLEHKKSFKDLAVNFLKRGIRILIPAAKPKKTHGWFGNYKSWQEAAKECRGYEAGNILDTVKTSVLKVKNGKAVYERDSVLFNQLQFSSPLLQAFNASVEKGKLHIIDFGGSLGSSYFQNRKLLTVNELRWAVVEQKHFVEAGKKEIAEQGLQFYYTIAEAIQEQDVQVLLLSSVVQYFENPYQLIAELLSYNFKYIIVDRTAFIEDAAERITRQVVPPEIYTASYPAWFLNESKFVKAFGGKYELLNEFKSAFDDDGSLEDGKRIYRKGFYFKLKTR